MSTKRWLGNAAAITDVWTAILSGTVTSQTYTLTINGNAISYIASGVDTISTILLAIQNLWNTTSNTAPAEFQELTATAVPSGGPYTSLTLTQKSAGKPSLVSVSTNGSASFSISNTTIATGPSFFDNGQNWSGGAAPANSDTLIFDTGVVPCLYNIKTSLTGVSVVINSGYAGRIGLPFVNSDSSQNTYYEYRTTALTLTGGTVTINSASITRCNLAFGPNTATVRVLDCGRRVETLIPAILITGGNGSSELDITKGDVGVANYQGTTATFPTIKMSYVTQPASDAVLYCGPGATLTTISKNGGDLTINSAVTTLTQGPSGGTTVVVDGAMGTLECQGGQIDYNSSGTLTNLNISNGGIVTFDKDPRAVTVTNTINIYGDKASLVDNQKRVNSGTLTVQLERTASLNIQHGIGSLVTMA